MPHVAVYDLFFQVHFSINCNAINQHVNMSLLRLVHQFVTMIENINETRVQLSGHKADYQTHRKQDSKVRPYSPSVLTSPLLSLKLHLLVDDTEYMVCMDI